MSYLYGNKDVGLVNVCPLSFEHSLYMIFFLHIELPRALHTSVNNFK